MPSILVNRFKLERGAIFHVRKIKAALAREDWEPDHDNPGTERRCVYLGTVASCYPSGKFYTPFANSNVERHDACNGEGCDGCDHQGSIEAAADAAWKETWDKAFTRHEMHLEHGEFDSFDLFAVEYRDAGEDEDEENAA